MTAETLGWGIVGLGRIAGTQIAPAIGELPGHELAAVASRDQGRAEAFAKQHGAAAAYDSYPALLADPAVGAVYIATPNSLHAEQVIAAAAAGKHVLCDKPLATSLAAGEEAAAACAAAGTQLGLMFQTRRHQGMAEIHQALASGQLGQVVAVQLEMSGGRTLLSGWRTDPSLAGIGTVNNIAVHAYDLLRFLLDAEVTEVTAMLGTEAGLQLDTIALALLRFGTGTLAYVNANQSVPKPYDDLVIYGTQGRITGRNVTRPDRDGWIRFETGDSAQELQVSSAGAYRRTIADFGAAVAAGQPPSPSGTDGLRSIEVSQAVAESARSRRTIVLA
jgi:1,5-anhydro-D-fructose reductase (1,5-anhydro-D-mannitol-forming)